METKTTENLGYYHAYKYNSLQRLNYLRGGAQKNMHGVKKVILFCIMIVIIPASLIILPLYLRHKVFSDVVYTVAESDIMEIRDGISTIFCERHSLRMNSSFNAFQLESEPAMSDKRKHIRLKKSMILPDDTLEYWGFYLLKGASVHLKVCSRYEGSRILVVKGERNLKTCGLLEHNTNKFDAQFAREHGNVVVTFETAVEIVHSAATNFQTLTTTYDNGRDENHGGEDLSGQDDENLDLLKLNSTNYVKKIKYSAERKKLRQQKQDEISQNTTDNEKTEQVRNSIRTSTASTKETDEKSDEDDAQLMATTTTTSHPHRHQKHKAKKVKEETTSKNGLPTPIEETEEQLQRARRDIILDGRVLHGGNNANVTVSSDSVSSFETGLLTCYDGQILLAQGFEPNVNCKNINYLDTGSFMQSVHEVGENGYYYYIFYSDNDLVSNDIHAVFNIFKPSFEYANISESKGCVNNTNCTFDIKFWSNEVVIIEIPTRDGIEDEDEELIIISTCQPRIAVYILFPVAVLFMVMCCAFI